MRDFPPDSVRRRAIYGSVTDSGEYVIADSDSDLSNSRFFCILLTASRTCAVIIIPRLNMEENMRLND